MRHSASAHDVAKALDELSGAEASVDRSILQALGIGPNDAKVLRFLLDLEATGEAVTPRMLTKRLGVSSAATTALIDRLVDAGWVEREPHPQDRRSILVRATVPQGSPARRLLAVRRAAATAAAGRLSASERRIVADFLADVARAEKSYLAEAGGVRSRDESEPSRTHSGE